MARRNKRKHRFQSGGAQLPGNADAPMEAHDADDALDDAEYGEDDELDEAEDAEEDASEDLALHADAPAPSEVVGEDVTVPAVSEDDGHTVTVAVVAPDSPGEGAAPAALSPLQLQGTPLQVLAEYERHSLAHVAGLPEQLDAPGLWRGVAYRIGRRRLVSRFDEVAEILPLPPVTPIPGAQSWMLGVANVRGTLLPVVDLKHFLEGERTVLIESQRVLVVRQPGGDVAVTVDQMYGQRSFQDEQITHTGELGEGRYGHFLDRAYLTDGQEWGVFSLDRLVRTPEFRQAAA